MIVYKVTSCGQDGLFNLTDAPVGNYVEVQNMAYSGYITDTLTKLEEK